MSTRAQILAEIAAQFPDNTAGLITPAKLRQVTEDLANSYNNSTDEPAQPLDADLTSIAALSTTSFGRSLLTPADAAGARAILGAGTSSFDGVYSSLTGTPTTLSGYGITDAQGLDADLTALAGLSANGLIARTGSGTAAARTITGTADQVIVTNGDGVAGNPTLALPQSIATTSTPQFAGAYVSGNVGIGTTSPAAKLDVSGSAYIRGADPVLFTFRDLEGGSGSVGSTLGGLGFAVDTALSTYGSATAAKIVCDLDTVDGSYRPKGALRFVTSDGTSIVERVRISSAGNVGIGTTSPKERLEVVGAIVTRGAQINYATEANAGLVDFNCGNARFLSFGSSDNRGGFNFYAAKQNNVDGSFPLTIYGNGVINFGAYGAGTLVTDSSGNITASSDRRLKNVSGKFTRGLAAIMEIQPKVFTWKPESGMNTDDVNVGFIAQDVQGVIPEAVGSMKTSDVEEDDGHGKKIKHTKREAAEFLALSDRPIIATLVNAVKELKAENDDLRARVSALENGKAAK